MMLLSLLVGCGEPELEDQYRHEDNFVLPGEHNKISCEKCHKSTDTKDWSTPLAYGDFTYIDAKGQEIDASTPRGAFDFCQDCHFPGFEQIFDHHPGPNEGYWTPKDPDAGLISRHPGIGRTTCATAGCHTVAATCFKMSCNVAATTTTITPPITTPTPTDTGDTKTTVPTTPTTPTEPRTVNSAHYDVDAVFPLAGVHAKGCMDCHDIGISVPPSQGNANNCTGCHGVNGIVTGKQATDTDGLGGHYPDAFDVVPQVGVSGCATCHYLEQNGLEYGSGSSFDSPYLSYHDSSGGGDLALPHPANSPMVSTCTHCHLDLGAQVADNNTADVSYSCPDCHFTVDQTNLMKNEVEPAYATALVHSLDAINSFSPHNESEVSLGECGGCHSNDILK